jgi:hypothetical protein
MTRFVSPKLFGLALVLGLVSVLGAGSAFAQYGYPQPRPGWGDFHDEHEHDRDDDDDHWRHEAPVAQYGYEPQPGYYYDRESPAHETAERARSFGYHDGLAEGQRDRMTGHSFRPTHSDRYEDASDHGDHHGMSRGEFKSIYREAYLRGYQRGYGSY